MGRQTEIKAVRRGVQDKLNQTQTNIESHGRAVTERSASARTEFIMAKLDNTIEELAHRIFSKEEYFLYKGMKFGIQEMDYANPMDFTSFTRISVILPKYFQWDTPFSCGVSYDSTYTKGSRTTYLNRCKACVELATHFVMDVLPKVDFELKKEVNNYEVEKILEVLE